MLGRRLLTPFGGVCVFLAIVLLVAGGLGWVTAASLKVEAAERDATARADATTKERLALWQLDSRMFPTLAIENGRPYAQYFSLYIPHPVAIDDAGNVNNPGRVPSPLLSAELPDWMLLHFQLDPDAGWRSPQVLPEDVAKKLRKQFGEEMLLVNDTPPRRLLLKELSDKFSPKETHKLFFEQERATDANDGSFSVPDTGESPNNTLPMPTPNPPAAVVQNTPAANDAAGRTLPPGLGPPSPKQAADPNAAVMGRGGYQFQQNNLQQPPPGYARSTEEFNGNSYAKRSDGAKSALKDSQAPADQTATKNNSRSANPGGAPPGASRGGATPAPAPSAMPAAGGAPTSAPAPAGPPGPGGFGGAGGRGGRDDDAKRDAPAVAKKAAEPPAEKKGAKLEAAPPPKPQADAREPDALRQRVDRAFGAAIGGPEAAVKAKAAVNTAKPPAVQVGPIHPQWLTAEDGSPYLVLVRAARLETKTVFQGVVLDWAKLKDELLDEIRPDFPQAELTPVYDGEKNNERQMAAIPARLDPGPAPQPPPVGWTPLRWGLTLGWGTALVALAAIWFGGRALIDLSERRIRFVSAVTHELRTPLTSLRLYLDLLTSGMIEDEEKQKEYLRTLHGESDRLNRLIENVLDFARLEKQTVQTHVTPTKVDTLLETARATWADRCAADGKELVVIGTVPIDQTVNTDARMAGQILSNLIDNARKYSVGAADPRIWVWAKPGDGKRIVLEVEDRGPGVPLAERATIFRPFRRGSSADTTAGGAGLGLALAKQWAEMLGGRLSYRLADGGAGACFRLELPI